MTNKITIALLCLFLSTVSLALAQTPSMPENDVVRAEDVQNWDDVQDNTGGEVDIFDLTFIATRYGSENPAADLNQDGLVDIFDLSVVAANYGLDSAETPAILAAPTSLAPVDLPVGAIEGDYDQVLAQIPPFDGVQIQSFIYHPLKVGVTVDRVFSWDTFDPTSAPDFYGVLSVGGSPVRTGTLWNTSNPRPYWRIGWWQYTNYPRFNADDPANADYAVPITFELRDDDGQFCYGELGCYPTYEVGDLTRKWVYARNNFSSTPPFVP